MHSMTSVEACAQDPRLLLLQPGSHRCLQAGACMWPAACPSHCLVCCLQSARALQAGAQVQAGALSQGLAAAGQTSMYQMPLETRGALPAGAGVAPAQGGELQPCRQDRLLAHSLPFYLSPWCETAMLL